MTMILTTQVTEPGSARDIRFTPGLALAGARHDHAGDAAAEHRARPYDLDSPLLRNPKAMIGLAIILFLRPGRGFRAADSPGDPPKRFVARPHLPPSSAHWLGTTARGRMCWRRRSGARRTTLAIGFVVGILTTIVGVRRRHDRRLFPWQDRRCAVAGDECFPDHPGAAVARRARRVSLGRSGSFLMHTRLFVLVFAGWAWPARVLRSQTLSLREKDFVSAAVVSGESKTRIIFREIFPNMSSIVVASFSVRPSCDRRRGGARVPRSRQSQPHDLGHQSLLGAKQRRIAPRRLVDLCSGGSGIALVAFGCA